MLLRFAFLTSLSCIEQSDCFTDRYGHKTRLDWVDLAANASPSRIQLKKSNIWRHIKYNHTTRENDLALVFLDSKVNVQPVRLDDSSGYPLSSGVSLNVTGWGPKSLDGLYVDRQQTVTELYASNLKSVDRQIYLLHRTSIVERRIYLLLNRASESSDKS